MLDSLMVKLKGTHWVRMLTCSAGFDMIDHNFDHN